MNTAKTSKEDVVEVTGLHKSFDPIKVLDNVSFKVPKGEVVCLLGPSGCGKTTTLRCIAGLEKPDEGQITIGGDVVFSKKDNMTVPPERRDIGFVFQNYALWPHMNVLQHVTYGLKRRKKQYKEEGDLQAKHILDLLGLSDLSRRYPFQLSGGQQQRVALARALAYSPKVLLLDEPLSNIDEKERERVLTELRALFKRLEITAIYVTHDQREAFTVGDFVVLFSHGKIIQQGLPEEVYQNPANEFAAKFLGKSNMFRGNLVQSDGWFFCPDGTGLKLKCDPLSNKEGPSIAFIRRNEIGLQSTALAPRSDVTVLPGKLISRTFMGDVIQYVVALEDLRLVVWGHKFCSFVNADNGSDLFIVIPSESVHVQTP